MREEERPYPAKFYELGNFHYRPEDQEHAKNPMFRITREFQAALKLEIVVQEIYINDAQHSCNQQKFTIAQYRLQQLQFAVNCLDNYYAGREVVHPFISGDRDQSKGR